MLERARLVFAALVCACAFMATAAPALTTQAERSGFRETGRYDEVIALCGAFAKAHPKAVRCTQFGRSPEGRPMLALVASRSGALDPAAAHKRGLPVVLVQGGIHAGEIDGKDAGFLALREILDGRVAPGVLDNQVLVFVPVFNVDGHERRGHWNRPNQRGPEAMGWRTTAQNFNLNRDYVKADAPEMQAMLKLVAAWDPIATIDLHVTDGAQFEHDVSIQVEPVHAGDAALREAGRAFRDAVIGELAARGSLPLPFYMSFAVDDDPASGFVDSVSPPRFSTGYFLLRNRYAMLVETHSWKDYPTRVRVTHDTVVAVLRLSAAQGRAWLALARDADARAAHLAGATLPLTYKATETSHTIEFRGYEYTRALSEVSGATVVRYDETKPQIWRVPLRDEIVPDETAIVPGAGYLVPPAYAATIARMLAWHGVAHRIVARALPALAAETFRAEKVSFTARSIESHQRLALQGAWRPETRDVAAGALFVPIAQPKARLVVALFEPRAPDSYAAWGIFNTAFERKEAMEDYVADAWAREQLASDPALRAAFNARLAADPEFAKSAAARLEFFARRHPSWDERYELYPVLRLATAPP
jgi:hypothetical protein